MQRIPTYLLAGGRSVRFGTDKARAELDRVPLILRLARQVETIAAPLIVVADRCDKYLDLGLTTIADVLPGLGPLGGLHAAMSHATGSCWTLVLSCDLLELRTEWLDELERHAGRGVQAVAFRDRFWQAFPGLYHTSLLSPIEQQIESGELAIGQLIRRTASLGLALPADWPAVVQANTRGDLDAYAKGTAY
ncbi:molybdenum cofactor guanylyltransferase [Myxococcota bacterium]